MINSKYKSVITNMNVNDFLGVEIDTYTYQYKVPQEMHH